MKRVIAVVGPTAGGKSSLALELARRHNGEIVSCDSMQIYRGMDIGTAKATPEEQGIVPHHMTDIIDPSVSYSCADYARDASAAIDDIISRGKLPVICGGTGLYLNALLFGSGTADMEFDEGYRASLEAIAEAEGGRDELFRMLTEIDSAAAESIHKNNVKRVIRALEINHSAGITKAEWDRRSLDREKKYDTVIIGLNYRSREELYRRIEERVDIMIEDGLIAETERLFKAGMLDESYTASQAIGYKEILPYVKGECSLETAAEELKKATRRYAKRQLTWFCANEEINWIYPDESPYYGKNSKKTFEDIVNIAEKLFINYK
ncbi:MAG: tRNA (adenosine(37)-N6)-dimethylallyltransferase MiaA [Clostridia bacterium]|nr:tRNA (adenosine(37)-N6)-dimethylallyltransferase MiaA [Clostridia bacterium]